MDGGRDRVTYLLRAAMRAEGEGNIRAARNLRLMARDAHQPVGPSAGGLGAIGGT